MPLITQKRFTGRDKEKEIFREKLVTPQAPDEYRIITFYGVGGQGKSALYHYLQDIGKDQKEQTFSNWAKTKGKLPDYKIAPVNFENTIFQQSHEALMEIRQGFLGTEIDFHDFDFAFMHYLKKAYPNLDMRKEYWKLFDDENTIFSDVITSIGMTVALAEPITGTSISFLGLLSKYASKLKREHKQWYETKGKPLEFELENLNQQQLLEKLPEILGDNIKKSLEINDTLRPVIMVDTYEALQGKTVSTMNKGSGIHDEWVRKLVTACSGALFVIFGRDEINWDDYSQPSKPLNYSEMLKGNQHLLDELSNEDAHLFLKNAGIVEAKYEPIRNVIVESSKGLPFYLELQLDTFLIITKHEKNPAPELFGGTKQEIIDKFLSYLNDYEQNALYVLSPARTFNKKLFELLKKEFFTGSPVFFEYFIIHSFNKRIEASNYYSMHQLMQKHLQEKLKNRDSKLYQEIMQCIFNYYDELAIVTDIRNITSVKEDALIEANYYKEKADFKDYVNWFYQRIRSFQNASRYRVVITLYEELLELAIIHDNIINVAVHRNNLASFLMQMGNYDEVEFQLKTSIKIYEENNVIDSGYSTQLNNLAVTYRNMGAYKYKEAEELFVKSLKIDKKLGIEKTSLYADHLGNYANFLKSTRRFNEAKDCYLEMLEIEGSQRGKDSKEYAVSLSNYADFLCEIDENHEAEKVLIEVLKIDKATIGSANPEYARHLNNMGRTLKNLQRLEEAEHYYREAIKVDRIAVEEVTPSLGVHLGNLANLLVLKNEREEAEELFREALQIYEKTVGRTHRYYAIHSYYLSGILLSKGNFMESKELLREAASICDLVFDNNHPMYIEIKNAYFLSKN